LTGSLPADHVSPALLAKRFFLHALLKRLTTHVQVTRERIRQIESKALRKMRQPARQGVLMDYKNGIDTTVIPDRKGLHRDG
jgi:Sigma-70, region 4